MAAARKKVPHSHALVVGHREQVLSIRVEAQVCNPVIVSDEFGKAFAVFGVPNSNSFVSASTG